MLTEFPTLGHCTAVKSSVKFQVQWNNIIWSFVTLGGGVKYIFSNYEYLDCRIVDNINITLLLELCSS